MAIYNASLLISASNATYFTNVTGGIAAVAVRDFNDTWISSSALLTGSNTFVGNQIISGNVDINGTISASLQTGYIYVGNGNGRTQAVATSSIVTNINTGSFATTGSNTFYGNQNIVGDIQLQSGSNLGKITFPNNAQLSGVYGDQFKFSASETSTQFLINSSSNALNMIFENRGANGSQMQFTNANGNVIISASSFQAPLNDGYMWVGDSSNNTTAITTASFVAQITSSIPSINTGSFATTGSNVFTGFQQLYTEGGQIPLQISSSAYYGIQLQNQGIQITGNGGPRIQFPNATWLNGNENDAFQFTGDTDNPLTRGIDFYLYGSGSRTMRFRNISGPGGTIQFETSQSAITFTAGDNIGITAGNNVNITGSQVNIQNLRYPATDGTNGQALITNGSGLLSFGNVSINTGSFATTGSNTFTGNQTIQSGSQIIFNGLNGSSNDNGLAWGTSTSYPAKLFYQSGSGGNFLQFQGDVGIDFSVGSPATANSNINFRTQNAAGNIQFTSESGSIALRANTTAEISGSGVRIQNIQYPNTDGTAGQVITTNGSGVLTFTTVSGGATGSFATLGANTFTGSQTIQSGSILTFNGFSGPGTNGISFGGGNASMYYTTGSINYLQIGNANAGIDVQVNNTANANSNMNFTNSAPTGSVQFIAQSGSISFRSENTLSIGNRLGGQGEAYLLGYSGSLVLANSVVTNTYASLSHISSSQPNGNGGLIFKNNSNTGTTLLNGSANIFQNPNTPTTGYIRYVGGSNNLYLNNNNGVTSQITSSAISVSGARPVMSNNIFNGTSNFTINQAVNPGSHTYSHNILSNGATTINALGFTGSLNLSQNYSNSTITLNPASASVAEIALGLSGSGTMNVTNNGNFGGGMFITSPRIISPAQTTNAINNVLAGGTITVTNISSSFAVNSNGNVVTQNMIYNNSLATAVHTSVGGINGSQGGMQLTAIASAITATNNLGLGVPVITNTAFSGSLGTGNLNHNRNLWQGQGNTLTVTGSVDAGQLFGNFSDNAMVGKANTIFSNQTGQGSFNSFNGNLVGGYQLIVSASNSFVDGNTQGGGYFGRWNANDGIRNKSGENVFFVGTGTSTSNRKTGFLIDSGSNTFIEGTLNVSGSSSMTGSIAVTGNQTLQSFTILSNVSASLNYADDTAAAAGGVPLGGLYRNGNFVMIRLT